MKRCITGVSASLLVVAVLALPAAAESPSATVAARGCVDGTLAERNQSGVFGVARVCA